MKFFRLAFALILAGTSQAATFYVTQNGVAPFTLTNSVAGFGAWTNGIGGGDFVHFVGTLTSRVSFGAGGSSGNPLTLVFDAGAKFSTTVFTPSCFDFNGHSYITVIGTGAGTTNFENTANGSGKAFTNASTLLVGGTTSHFITISNCVIGPVYDRIPSLTEGSIVNIAGACAGVTFAGSGWNVVSNVIHDAENGVINAGWTGGLTQTNWHIDGNDISQTCIAIALDGDGTAANSRCWNGSENGNNIHHTWKWSAQAITGLHFDGIYNFLIAGAGSPSCSISNLSVQGNTFGPHITTNLAPADANTTACIFMTWYNTTNLIGQKIVVANNVALCPTTNEVWKTGLLACGQNGTGSICANNTLIDGTGNNTAFSSAGSGTMNFLGNFCSGVGTGENCYYGSFFSGTNFQPGYLSDSNCFYNLYSGSGGMVVPAGTISGNGQVRWSDWVNATIANSTSFLTYFGILFDQHSTLSAPSLQSDGLHPAPNDTILTGNGPNLTSYGITEDHDRNARPSSGPWTIGAFQISSTNVTAAFTGAPLVGPATLAVTFADGSLNATNWSWTFGDSGTSTSQNPAHNYTSPGTYTVALTIIGLGQSSTLTRTSYISATNAPSGGGGGSGTNGGYAPFQK